MPIYINIVRHPVSRIHSWYYYIRAPSYHVKASPHNVIESAPQNNSLISNDTNVESRFRNNWNYKNGQAPNIKFLKTPFNECVEKKSYECLYIPGILKINNNHDIHTYQKYSV